MRTRPRPDVLLRTWTRGDFRRRTVEVSDSDKVLVYYFNSSRRVGVSDEDVASVDKSRAKRRATGERRRMAAGASSSDGIGLPGVLPARPASEAPEDMSALWSSAVLVEPLTLSAILNADPLDRLLFQVSPSSASYVGGGEMHVYTRPLPHQHDSYELTFSHLLVPLSWQRGAAYEFLQCRIPPLLEVNDYLPGTPRRPVQVHLMLRRLSDGASASTTFTYVPPAHAREK